MNPEWYNDILRIYKFLEKIYRTSAKPADLLHVHVLCVEHAGFCCCSLKVTFSCIIHNILLTAINRKAAAFNVNEPE